MNNYFYDITNDLQQYNDAIIYLILGGRNTGKTYSTLKHFYTSNKKFVFIKRTIEDVKLLCSGASINSKLDGTNREDVDLSPYKSINRDLVCNVKPFDIDKKNGIACFYNMNEENEPTGQIVGYILALSSVYKFKGFDLSDVDAIIFDEFIPQKWERVKRDEGVQVLELYKTISRAREHIGKEPLKLICLANSTDIACPIIQDFDLLNDIAQMELNNQEYNYIEDRFILIHKLKDSEHFYEKEKQSPIYKAMAGTKWVEMALENKFAYNDFTQISKEKLKGYRCLFTFYYKQKNYYVYYNDDTGHYYINQIPHNKVKKAFNLDVEIDARRMYYDEVIDILQECIKGYCTFSEYEAYDLFMNYKKIVDVG